jgi:hypothetical protein
VSRGRRGQLIEVNSVYEIPEFASEAEEAEFWDTHRLGPALLSKMERASPLEKPAGPIPAGLVAHLPVSVLRARLSRLKIETEMAAQLFGAAEKLVLRWMRDERERAPEWILAQLDDLEAQLDRLADEQEPIEQELERR